MKPTRPSRLEKAYAERADGILMLKDPKLIAPELVPRDGIDQLHIQKDLIAPLLHPAVQNSLDG